MAPVSSLEKLSSPTERNSRQSLDALFSGTNAAYVMMQYAAYCADPHAVDLSWQRIFQDFSDPSYQSEKVPVWPHPTAPAQTAQQKMSIQALDDSLKAVLLIDAFRTIGHLAARVDPLQLAPLVLHPELDPDFYGFTQESYDRPIYLGDVFYQKEATLKELLEKLKRTYCGTVSIEFSHLHDPQQRTWLQNHFEHDARSLQNDEKKIVLKHLLEAEKFERFLHLKFQGAKRFGLDGGESLIPALQDLLVHAAHHHMQEISLGMSHRGRLSVLTHIMGKPFHHVIALFKGADIYEESIGSGDVKYHEGYSNDRLFNGHTLHLSLTPNPSHLEAVYPVTLGKVRGKQTTLHDTNHEKVMGIVIHGDAAFIGQGVVSETLQLSQLQGYKTGGTLHIVINNQIGFTAIPKESRTSTYCSDVAKAIQAPIFHVNGDDPESVMWVTRLAYDFRRTFKRDVVIDLVCYRRYGHNESDEPAFTQPLMYKTIQAHPSVATTYQNALLQQGIISPEILSTLTTEIDKNLQSAYTRAEALKNNETPKENQDWLQKHWAGVKKINKREQPITGLPAETLTSLTKKLTQIPQGFTLNPKIQRLLEQRLQAFEQEQEILLDWGFAETLAFGSILHEGYPIRLSGQDSERGTFSHRHAVWTDQVTEMRYIPLNHLAPSQGNFEIINSPLSEEAVLGFEYGYSWCHPHALTIWEGQFGDFANGAQIMIDQFIASAEQKWLRLSGLVLLLPHGFEGQGPEHSSARLERFLQLCAQDNLQVMNCSTPANYFHALRRQIYGVSRKPLILMTPKSLLRDKLALSPLTDLTEETQTQLVINDTLPAENITRVILCSGKIYYDLLKERNASQLTHIALVRLEQLYPFPEAELCEILRTYPTATLVWCQEEPKNMGAWNFLDARLQKILKRLSLSQSAALYVGRHKSASPAVGSAYLHAKEQAFIVQTALQATILT